MSIKVIRKQTKMWTTKDGRKIRICDMSDQHLVNTIRMLIRNAKRKLQDIINSYYRFPSLRGEMAQMAFESESFFWEFEADWTDCVGKMFMSMQADYRRRGLNTLSDKEMIGNQNEI